MLTAADAVVLVKAEQKGVGRPGPITLRGQWGGWLACDSGAPRVERVCKLAAESVLRIVSVPIKGWSWRLKRTEKWFSKAGADEGTAPTLLKAIEAGLARAMGLLGEACNVRDSRRRAALDTEDAGEHPVRPAKEGKDPTERFQSKEPRTPKVTPGSPWTHYAHDDEAPEAAPIDKPSSTPPRAGTPKTHSNRRAAPAFSTMHNRLSALSKGLVDRLWSGRPQTDADAEAAIDAPGQKLTAWRELGQVARHFSPLTQRNFPKIDDGTPAHARRVIRNTLTALEPAIALHGKTKSERAMQQFRMPGFPLVMVATSVVQEGVDLHTFCRKVIHYGIDGSATGTEQRNGRVDRRGSMIARLLPQDPKQRIEVYFPHLRQTLEPIQMMQLYQKMNRFMLMANDLGAEAEVEGATVDAERAVLALPDRYPKPYADPLETAFGAVKPRSDECVELVAAPHSDITPPEAHFGDWGRVGLSTPVREGAHLRWNSLTARDEQRGPLELSLKLDSGIEPGEVTLMIEAIVEKIELNDRAKPPREALTALLADGPRAHGVFWVARPLSNVQTALVLRSEVPVRGFTLTDDAVSAWVQRVAVLADEQRAALWGQKPTLTLSGAPQGQPFVVELRAALMPAGDALERLVPGVATSSGDGAAGPNSEGALALDNPLRFGLDEVDEVDEVDDPGDEDDQEAPQADRGRRTADRSLRSLALLRHNDQLRGPRLLLLGETLYATADLVCLQGQSNPTAEARRRAQIDEFAASFRARCNVNPRIG